MEARCLSYIAKACGGRLAAGAPDAQVTGICTDSRQVQPGDLFFAIAGERFDGHDFLPEVIEKNAAAVVVNEPRVPGRGYNGGIIAAEDTRRALGQFGAAYRADFRLAVIAVGGSNGKTTTKELLAAVLGQRLRTLASEASFNNDVGVPLTLLKLEKMHEVAV